MIIFFRILWWKKVHKNSIYLNRCRQMYGFILRSLTFETAEILKRPHVTSLSVSGGLVLLWVWLVSLLSPLPVWPHPLSPQVPENTHSHAHNTAVVFSNTHIWIITFIQVIICLQTPPPHHCPITRPAALQHLPQPTNQPLSVCCQETTNPLQVWQQSPDTLDTLTAIRAVTNKWLVNTLLEVFIWIIEVGLLLMHWLCLVMQLIMHYMMI